LQLKDRDAAIKKSLMKGDGVHLSMGAAVVSTLHDWMRGLSGGYITSVGVPSDGQPAYLL